MVHNLSHRKIVGPGRLNILRNMEITTFDVPANDWRSFEYAHRNFTQYVYLFEIRYLSRFFPLSKTN